MELGRDVHTGTATNRSNSLVQLPSLSYVPISLPAGVYDLVQHFVEEEKHQDSHEDVVDALHVVHCQQLLQQ